ncbi:MAG: ABC transporter substrate-binding protein [Gemmatimonadales bacterium]
MPRTLIALTLLIAACSSGSDPVVIGLAGPFSQPRGQSMKLAAELARAEINRAGGINGRPLDLAIFDDSANADVSVRVAQRLYDDDRVLAVVGHLTSGATLAAAPIYNGGATPVVEITPSASSPSVSAAGPYTFAVCPTDLAHGVRLARWAWQRLGASTVAVLYQNDDYGRGVRTAFTRSFEKLGGKVIAQDPYLPGMNAYDPYLRLFAERRPDALMIAGSRVEAESIMAGMRAVGLSVPVLGADGLSGAETSAAIPASLYITLAYHPDQPGERNREFVQAYAAAYGGRLPDHRGAGAYDAIYLLARAIREGGASRDRIKTYLDGVGTATPAFEGVSGRFVFGPNGDVPDKDVLITMATGGHLIVLSQE